VLLGSARTLRAYTEEREVAPRASCPLAPGAGQPIVEMVNDAGIEVQFVTLASDAKPAADEPRRAGLS
jgi:hypothetical protein